MDRGYHRDAIIGVEKAFRPEANDFRHGRVRGSRPNGFCRTLPDKLPQHQAGGKNDEVRPIGRCETSLNVHRVDPVQEGPGKYRVVYVEADAEHGSDGSRMGTESRAEPAQASHLVADVGHEGQFVLETQIHPRPPEFRVIRADAPAAWRREWSVLRRLPCHCPPRQSVPTERWLPALQSPAGRPLGASPPPSSPDHRPGQLARGRRSPFPCRRWEGTLP